MSSHPKKKKPEWVPENASEGFSTNVVSGISPKSVKKNKSLINESTTLTKNLTVKELAQGILNADRTVLAKAITLTESNSGKHFDKAQEILKKIIPHSGNSIRIGITGPPGVGKSTFIESLGSYLCESGKHVAVLAIDPSSTGTKGAILGDKTRMEKLSRHKNSFIRPSASGGTLGGVARKTRETVTLCEAAGFDIILIETIGVGQSEVTVRSMVDYFLLLILPGSGDELQGIKKGVVELANGIAVNKADGDNLNQAKLTCLTYADAVHYLMPSTEGWNTNVMACSAMEDKGIKEIWDDIQKYIAFTKTSGLFEVKRKEQLLLWVYQMIEETLKNKFYGNPKIEKMIKNIEAAVLSGKLTPANAVQQLFEYYNKK